MANQSGTLTSSQGSAIIGTTPNDTITFTPSSGTYTVEYPLGTTAISASTGAQSLSVSGGQLRLTCATGSVAWSVADGNDGTPLSQTELSSVRSLVSVAGNLAYADVATTTGTPGEMRKLSDGPDKGAVLVWAIPEGRAVYAWCWQIYPLAAYL